MSFGTQNTDRKVLLILRILSDSPGAALGARIIAHRLKDFGVELGERAVRYHLKLMDEGGLTRLVGRDGRIITKAGIDEVNNARVRDKVGLVISKIELLAFRTSFDLERRTGLIPVNISVFPEEKFQKALRAMKPAFDTGLCVSNLVAVVRGGENIGEMRVPAGRTALATVCSIVINGTLLKAGVPMNSRFGGLLEMRDRQPLRFVHLINYDGCSLDPSEVFIRAKMTSVSQVAKTGNGNILANFREVPAMCQSVTERVVAKLKEAGIGGLLLRGNVSEPICEMPIDLNRIGLILIGGLNPVAAAEEIGIEAENHAMGTIIEYEKLVKFSDVLK